jgi:pseudaminic acid synthase
MKFNKIIKISNKKIYNDRCFIVAEISANHSGKLTILKKLIKKLKVIGVDAIKIQAYEADTITIKSDKKDFKIPKNNAWSKYNNLYNLYKKAETPFNWYEKIFKFCKKEKIIIFASVFDTKSFEILEKLKCPAYKIASPEITDIPLIKKIAKTKKTIIISNGLANLNDLDLAVRTVKKEKNKNLIVLKCTSAYPTPLQELNLKTIKDINKKFGCLVGFSDHTLGYDISIHAASSGAVMLEKHVYLKSSKTVDSFFSLNLEDFAIMIKKIRDNEIANGNIDYKVTKSSIKNLNGRRSLYVVQKIKKNEYFNNNNIKSIRPSFGLHPKYLEIFLNKKSKYNLEPGTRLKKKYLKK